jgi:sugar phosphate isomerase/epimerase
VSDAAFALSAFGDEIARDLSEQLTVLNDLNVNYLDLRSAWGTGLLEMTDEDVARVKDVCSEHGVSVACLGSPIGKSPIEAPIEEEMENLARVCEIGAELDCSRVRMFSFYPPDGETAVDYDQYLDTAAPRLERLANLAEQCGVVLLLENEKKLVGDSIDRCRTLLKKVENEHLRFLWDPANFVQVGEKRPTEEGWPKLGEYVSYIHVKDAHLADGGVCTAGEGDGQIDVLLCRLREAGYSGFLSLEPHLVVAGHSGGFTGADEMRRAVEALRRVMDETDAAEIDLL